MGDGLSSTPPSLRACAADTESTAIKARQFTICVADSSVGIREHEYLMLSRTVIVVLVSWLSAFALDTASSVTHLSCTFRNGQSFCTYHEPIADPNWPYYQYKLYESTAGPITTLSTATLVESQLLPNGGYLDGTSQFAPASRLASSALMAMTPDLSAPVSFGTGIVVRTAPGNRKCYYAVVTYDTRGLLSDSTISVGDNSLAGPVTELTAGIRPVLQLSSTNTSTGTPLAAQFRTSTAGLPMWFYLHGSGGSMPDIGDYWAMWGDGTDGFRDGIQHVARAYYDANTFGQPVVYAAPQDRVWRNDGLGQLETYWTGYDWAGSIQPYTQHWLNQILTTLATYYTVDPNRIYGMGKSMGGLGITYWGLRQTAMPFAAIFARVPVWWISGTISSMTLHKTINTRSEYVAGSATTYYNDQNSPKWLANCANQVPPVMWSNGRLDTSFPHYSMWTNAVAAMQAMERCHRGFAFAWNNGTHSTGGTPVNGLISTYGKIYRRNQSYPAFSGFTLDSYPGDGTAGESGPLNGDLQGCINCGWSWQILSDSATIWSASITNDQVIATNQPAITSLTIRNAQQFLPARGMIVSWRTTTGQSGSSTVDNWGLVTISGVNIGTAGITLTVTTAK